MSSVTPDGQYIANAEIEIGITFSTPVSVVGTPQLRLSSGANAFARFDQQATGALPATTLKFTYQVQSGENSADLDYAAVTSLELGDSTGAIVDTFGVPAQLTLPVPGAMRSLGWNKNLVVDTAPPTAVVTLSKNAVGSENNTATVAITLTEPSSNFTLSDLVATSNGVVLPGVLSDFVGSGRNYSALFTPPTGFTGTVRFAIAAGSFTDPAGNENVVLPDSGAQLYVDANAPVVRQVTSSTKNDVYNAVGNTVDIQVEFNTPVAIGGLGPEGYPFLELNSGTGARAEYVSVMGSVVTFRYTVAANEQSRDLDYRSVDSLKGGYILRLDTGTQALRTLPVPGSAGSLAANKNLIIDTLGPSVTITSSRYLVGIGQAAVLTFVLSEPADPASPFGESDVTISSPAAGSFKDANGVTTWHQVDPLTYTAIFTPVPSYTGQVAFTVDAKAFKDGAGNDNTASAIVSPIVVNTASPLAPTVNPLTTNKTSPTITGTTGANPLQTGQRLVVKINDVYYDNSSGAAGVQVAGNTWSLNLNTATPVVGTWAALVDGTYDVTAKVVDATGNETTDASQDELKVDTVAPSVVAVTSTALDSPPAYGIGKVILIDVELTEDVVVTGTPALQLNAGTGARAIYDTQPAANILRFKYMVGSGDATTDLDYATSSALTLNGGTIRDAARNDAVLNLATPGSAGSLAAAKNIAVESTVPTVAITSSTTSLRIGETATITLAFSEDVDLPVGNTVALGNASGTTAVPTRINPRTYMFTFTPAANVQGGLGTVLVAAGAFVDAAGNPSAPASLIPAIAIDTAAPSTPSVAPLTTKMPLPTLTGTVAPALGTGETLAVLLNGSSFTVVPVGTAWSLPLATATPDGGGTFAPLADGTYAVIATTRDLAGNVVEAVPANLVIDSVTPAAPVILTIVDDVAPVLGPVVSGGFTNDTSLLLTGTAEPGATVRIYSGSVLLGTATGSATWTFTATGVQDGVPYSFTARATDPAGNESLPSAAHAVTVDTSAPAAPAIVSALDDALQLGVIPNGGSTNDVTVTLTGTTEPGTVVNVFRNGDATPLGVATVTGSSWTFTTPSLPDGVHSFTARATDAAGNQSGASAGYTVTVDTTAPAAPVIVALTDDVSPLQGGIMSGSITNDTQPTLTGTAAAGTVAVTIYDRTSNTPLGTASLTGSNWAFTTPLLTNGATYLLAAIAEDAAGNTSGFSNSFSVTIDVDVPGAPAITSVIDDVAPILGPAVPGGLTNDTSLQLIGTAEPGATVRIYNGSVLLGTATGSTTWTFTATGLQDGVPYSFTARATDPAGNESLPSAAHAVTVDTSAPVAPVIVSAADDELPQLGVIPNGGSTNDVTVTLTGTTEPGTVVNVFRNGNATPLGTATVTGSSWTFTTPSLPDGVHTFTVRATDAAGNQSGASAGYTVTVDTVAASVLSVSSETPAGSYGAGTTIVFRVRFSEPVIVTGKPSIVLNTSPLRGAVYFAGTGTDELQFLYVVQPGDSAFRLDYVSADALTLNGGSIVDAAANAASIVLPPPVSEGAFRNTTPTIRIDARAPSVVGIAPLSPNGIYGLNQTVRVAVAFSEIVYVLDTPTIDLNTTPLRQAVYSGGSGTRVLTFDYAIQTGDFSSDLNYLSSTSLRLNGGVIRDGARNDANVTLPSPDALSSLGSQAAILVDAVIRAIATGLGSSPGTAPTFATAVTTIPITFNAPVTNFRLTDIRLFFENRSVSLAGAQLTGSGTAYTLTLRSTTASLKGSYRLVIGGPASSISSGGVFMTTPSKFYWRRA